MAPPQRLHFLLESGGRADGGSRGAGERAHCPHEPRNILEPFRLGHEHDDTERLESCDIHGLIAALPAEHEIGLEREDALRVHARRIPHFGQRAHGGRKIAEARHAGEPRARAGRERELGEVRGERDDAGSGRGKPHRDAAIVHQLEGLRTAGGREAAAQ